ncbi:hypothetical protein VMCG_04999 [Cytospora schulzeri]|uniref:Uncharacterized protein n=1 Tax=Cytospora schulzeri TaxID=448051 RepID=A0A423WM96_9PEZI|nr:hypothetical protein VMCG_04999 [Valsa malicola]
MYTSPYGFGNAAGQPFNGPTPGQSPHQMQPGPGPNQPHQQQMMYNQQHQFPMGASGAFPGGPNPAAMMPGGAGHAGMMQNTAMPQMAANGQMGFQTPYTSSPYGAGVPSTSGPQGQFNPNYMMANSMGGFPMSAAGMTPQQQMMQRMQQQAQQNAAGMGTPTPPRQFSGSQGTPNPALSSQQGHFGTPSNPQPPPQNQTPTQAPQSATSVSTPQTPTFPSTGQGPAVNGNSTPLSPVSQAKGQERISLLLEINQELLYEAVHLKHSMDEAKKEKLSSTDPEKQKEKLEEEEACSHDWTKRLQANLAYLASLADRKAPSQAAPAYLSPPPLNLKLKLRPIAPTPDAEKVDGSADREERENIIKEQYQKLQALFPGVDPNKVPTLRPQQNPGAPNPAAALQNAQRTASIGASQGQMQVNSAPSPAPSAQQSTPQMSTVSAPQSSQPMTSA